MSKQDAPLQFPIVKADKPTSAISRASRIIHILKILSQGPSYTVGEIAEILQTGERTIYRDINIIEEELHISLDITASHQYSVRDTHLLLPSVGLTLTEALSLVILCNECGKRSNLPFFETAASAASKIQGYLPVSVNAFIESVYKNINILSSPKNPLVNCCKYYREIDAAIRDRNTIQISYDSLYEGTRIKTKLQTYKLIFSGRSWYCIGVSELHSQLRMYNLSRIVSLKVLEETYPIPPNWTLKDYLGNAWNLIPGKRDYWVVIDFSAKVGYNVAEILWHKNQKTEWIDSKTMRFSTLVSGLEEISWWILGYGAEANVVEPPELRTLIASHVLQMYKKYAKEIKALK